MPHEDFDIDSLAAYLHLTPQQVAKLADRGELPGRKVSGQWRFSPAEIHHWLEERMGVLDDGQLARMEDALERTDAQAHDRPVTIDELLGPELIAAPLHARTKRSVIEEMCELAARSGLLWDSRKLAEAVRTREDMQTTALENGVALLHPRRPMPAILAQPLIALGRTGQGIPFGGSHGSLTDLFFLICSTDDRGHLRVLARLSRLIGDADLITSIREAGGPDEIHRLIVAKEEELGE